VLREVALDVVLDVRLEALRRDDDLFVRPLDGVLHPHRTLDLLADLAVGVPRTYRRSQWSLHHSSMLTSRPAVAPSYATFPLMWNVASYILLPLGIQL